MNLNGNKRKRAPLLAWKYLFVDLARLLAAPSVFLFLRPKWLYENEAAKKPIRGGALIASNHDSFLDPMYIMTAVWYRRMRIIATSDLYRHKTLAFFLRAVRSIEVDKQNFNFGTFRTVCEALEAGEIVTIFPEGSIHTGTQESVRAFKSGAVMMAQKANAPIVPIYIAQRKSWLNRQRYVVGEPVTLPNEPGTRASLKEINRLTEQLHETELRLKAISETYEKRKNGGQEHV